MSMRVNDQPACVAGFPDRGRSQRGFTLIEVLIALVVLSIGLLGVAKLVMSAVHADDSAYMRGQATQLANELLDEMRANKYGAQEGDYGDMPAQSDCIQSATACTAQALAQLDLYDWQQELATALPSGMGTVTTATDGSNETSATITITWDDSIAQAVFGASPNGTMTLQLVSVL